MFFFFFGWFLFFDDHVPLVEFIYLVFTRMPGQSYRRLLKSLLLCLCNVFFYLFFIFLSAN